MSKHLKRTKLKGSSKIKKVFSAGDYEEFESTSVFVKPIKQSLYIWWMSKIKALDELEHEEDAIPLMEKMLNQLILLSAIDNDKIVLGAYDNSDDLDLVGGLAWEIRKAILKKAFEVNNIPGFNDIVGVLDSLYDIDLSAIDLSDIEEEKPKAKKKK